MTPGLSVKPPWRDSSYIIILFAATIAEIKSAVVAIFYCDVALVLIISLASCLAGTDQIPEEIIINLNQR